MHTIGAMEMSSTKQWISERLTSISEEDFIKNVSRRLLKKSKLETLEKSYFSVPLSTGVGCAVLVNSQYSSKEQPEKGLIILVHALGTDATFQFGHVIPYLVHEGFSVLAFDWDGHGPADSSLLDMQESTRSIPLLINKLFETSKIQDSSTTEAKLENTPRCYLMGYSYGASLALLASTREEVARRINGVIAISPLLAVNSSKILSSEKWSIFNLKAWILDYFQIFVYYGFLGLAHVLGFPLFQKMPIRWKVKVLSEKQIAFFCEETFVKRNILNRVKVPVLWLHGLKDKISPYDLAAKIMLQIPRALFMVCDNSRGHTRIILNEHVLKNLAKFINNKFYDALQDK